MDMRTGLLSAFIVVSMVLAGCASGGGDGGEETQLEPTADLGAQDGSQLAGHVVDEQQLPIEGAQVALLQVSDRAVQAQTQTGSDGAFSFEGVPAGDWLLTAQRLGFETIAQQVSVVSGENQPDILLVLESQAASDAYYEIVHVVMEIDFGIAWAILGDFNDGCIRPGITCQGIGLGTIQHDIPIEEDENSPLATVVVEEDWEPNTSICSREIWIDWYSPEGNGDANPSYDNPYYWSNFPHDEWGMDPPIWMYIPRYEPGNPDSIDDPERIEKNDGDALEVDGNWWIRNFPPGRGITNLPADANCFFQQQADVYVTAFFLEPGPRTFTALPDA